MTAEEANLGHRSHKEWLEGHNPAIVDEIYAPDCVLYANSYSARPEVRPRGVSRPMELSCTQPSPT